MSAEQQRALAFMRSAFGLADDVFLAPVNERLVGRDVENVDIRVEPRDNGLVDIVVTQREADGTDAA